MIKSLGIDGAEIIGSPPRRKLVAAVKLDCVFCGEYDMHTIRLSSSGRLRKVERHGRPDCYAAPGLIAV